METICFIDDDEIFLYSMRALVMNRQIADEVLLFENPQEAIDHLENLAPMLPGLILVDINLLSGGINGWDFAKALDGLPKNTKKPGVYMVTSSSEPLESPNGFDSVDGCLRKPVTFATLQALADKHLGR